MTSTRLVGAALVGVGLATQAGAGAFQLREGSATSIGAALAGRTANDADVSLSIQNPATLRGVENFEVSNGISLLFAQADATANVALPGFTSNDDPNEDAIIPSFAIAYRLDPEWVIGLAIDSPFGLATEYDSNFVGSFDGVRSELTTITVTPMVSWEPTPGFALGIGASVQYADAKLTNRGLNMQEISGDGFAYGLTVGFLVEPVKGSKLGLNFQTGYDHELEGSFSDPFVAPALAAQGLSPLSWSGDSGTAKFELPPILSIGLIQDVANGVRVMAEAEWTGWSVYESVKLRSDDSPGVFDDMQNYEDSFMFALGAEYDVNEDLTVRAGAARDLTPTRDRDRTVRVPDADRTWLAVGASYDITENIGVDAAYLYILVDDSTVTLKNGPSAGATVDYEDGDVHLFALNLRYAF